MFSPGTFAGLYVTAILYLVVVLIALPVWVISEMGSTGWYILVLMWFSHVLGWFFNWWGRNAKVS